MSDTSRILVIDDEKNYLMVMQALLADAGYEVTALSDPEMALHFLEESEVDVVITDMKMPKLSGKEVLQRVKKSWPQLPVLIMTAFGSIESAVEAMRYGAFDYITKPFANDEMLLSVHNAVELSKAHHSIKLIGKFILKICLYASIFRQNNAHVIFIFIKIFRQSSGNVSKTARLNKRYCFRCYKQNFFLCHNFLMPFYVD